MPRMPKTDAKPTVEQLNAEQAAADTRLATVTHLTSPAATAVAHYVVDAEGATTMLVVPDGGSAEGAAELTVAANAAATLEGLAVTTAALELLELPVGHVNPAEHNPRADLDLDPEFIESIRTHGILEPVLVAPMATHTAATPGYDLIAGHRRFFAAIAVGLPTVPAVVRPAAGAEGDVEVLRLVENLQRRDVNPVDEARAYDRLVRVHGMAQATLAAAVGRNQGHVSKRLTMLKVGDKILARVAKGDVSLEDAVDLARLPAAVRDAAIEQASKGGNVMTVVWEYKRKAEELAERGRAIKTLKGLDSSTKGGLTWYDASDKTTDKALATLTKVGLDSPEHAGCPGRVVVVETRATWGTRLDGSYGQSWTREYCATPDAHAEDGQAELDAERKAAAAEQRARREQLEAMSGARLQVAEAIVGSKTTKALTEYVLRAGLAAATVRGGTDTMAYGHGLSRVNLLTSVLGEAVPAAADSLTGDALAKAGLRLQLMVAEQQTSELLRRLSSWDLKYYAHPVVRLYLELLGAHGHQLTDEEQQVLDAMPSLAAWVGAEPWPATAELEDDEETHTNLDATAEPIVDEYYTPDDEPEADGNPADGSDGIA